MLTIVDVLPTILDHAGGDYIILMESFLPMLRMLKMRLIVYLYGVATRQNIQSAVFPSRMVSDGKFKLIRNYNSIEVYDKNLTENNNHFIQIEF